MYKIVCLLLMIACQPQAQFKSQRIQRTAVIAIRGSMDAVFPLFGPIREKEWAHGWDPQPVYPEDPPAETHMVFTTRNDYNEESLWALTQFDPEKYLVEYTVTATG